MSLSAALSVALSGLQASTTAAQIISGNISNAKTTGYTEKTVNLSQQTTGNQLGGVVVSGYSRVSDTVLQSTYNDATSNSSYLSTQNGYMSQVQSVLDSSSNPPALSSAVANFQSAWTQFSAAPESATQQQAVIAAGQTLASTISNISTAATSLQSQVQTDLNTTISSLNTSLAQVQTLNVQIASALANSQPTGDLQDQRDVAINAVAAITNVQIMQRSNGQIALYTPGGTALVDGQAQVFSLSSSGSSIVNAVGADVSSELTGGKLQAQTDFLSTTNTSGNGAGVVTKLQSQLQNLANMFVSTATGSFASTYNNATTNTGEQGTSFFTASTASNGLPDLSSFAVNSSLVSGATSVKQAAASGISNTFTATNLAIDTTTTPASTTSTFSATGLIVKNQTFAGISNSILSGFQQAANTIQNSSATATTQQTYYQNALSAETGVNTDTELVNLTNWQNSYAASAHVISTIQSMFKTLENLI
jgi:flagellar hook-associated protein 1 FlgK